MAANDTPPRFFKVFISNFSSVSMLIPDSYYDELPSILPKTAILQGTGGCFWKVEMKRKRDEVYFGKGWDEFVKDNSLSDGDFLTFVYNGDRIFEVSIYGPDACKETRAVTEVEDVAEDSTWSVSSKDTDTSSESEMANTIPSSKITGKSKVEVVEESDNEEDSVYTDTDSCSEFKVAKTIPRSRKKGKKKEKVVESSNEDSDSEYIEASGRLDVEESSNTDSSYAPDWEEDTTATVKPKVTNPKKKGMSKLTEDADANSDSSDSVVPAKRKRETIKSKKIKDPEKYLDNPNNVHFETNMKNRKYELLVTAQLLKDYCLKFQDSVYYIDHHRDGKLRAKTTKWKDQRVCIKKWKRICERNELKKGDGILCELLRKRDLVYAIRIHIIREKDL